jgi:hypothetical protein
MTRSTIPLDTARAHLYRAEIVLDAILTQANLPTHTQAVTVTLVELAHVRARIQQATACIDRARMVAR